MKLTNIEEQELSKLSNKYLTNGNVLKMKEYNQHGVVTTYDHAINVLRMSYWLNKRLKLNANPEDLVASSILHDFYLYDWHTPNEGHNLHGFHHARRSMNNAIKYFNVNKKVQKAILCHMWPLNINRVPASKEAIILCIADKYCATHETLFQRKEKRNIIKSIESREPR